ncbi:hypothetical protein LCGC14_0487330 [marine sediment metagenome]|uniref:Recombination endonuclease VII n=1 Tax=marine sediment metagenome TaxID=412755 RepID=A0A0F9SD04_9ZZZZ
MGKKKRCPDCEKELRSGEFYTNKSKKGGLSSYCRECTRRQSRKYRKNNLAKCHGYERKYRRTEQGQKISRETARKYRQSEQGRRVHRRNQLRIKYGLTPEQHEQIYLDQNGCCALCGDLVAYDRVNVDHDHRTSRIRGLLCNRCNHGLGSFGDTLEGLQKAVNYLKEGD